VAAVKFVAKERKTIDAIRWTGYNVGEIVEWAHSLGLVIVEGFGLEGQALAWQQPEPGEANLELWACTLHGEVEIERGSWAAYGGTDVYPLDDGELHRLYDPVTVDEEEAKARHRAKEAVARRAALVETGRLLDEFGRKAAEQGTTLAEMIERAKDAEPIR
jgi:hypothetical protein